MNAIMVIKSVVFLLSLIFSGMFIDDMIENIILFSKDRGMGIFTPSIYIISAVLWSIFYTLTLL